MDSITEIGLLNPITVDSDNSLIASLRRYEAYKLLGRKTIPAIVDSEPNRRKKEVKAISMEIVNV